MKRIRVMKQSEEYYEVDDDFELNELTYKDLSPMVSITQGVQLLSVTQFGDPATKEKLEG